MSISITDTTSRDHCIIEMLEEHSGVLFNVARKRGLDYEDIKQDASLLMLQAWPKIPATCTDVKAYLARCIRNGLIKFHRYVIEELELSLDMPMAQGDVTLADTLAAPPQQEQDTTRADTITETIHSALAELMTYEQEYAIHAFGIAGFTVVANEHKRNKRMKTYHFPFARADTHGSLIFERKNKIYYHFLEVQTA